MRRTPVAHLLHQPARALAALAPLAALAAFTSALVACGSVAAPPSRFPDAKSAVDRLDATYASVSGVRGHAKIDYLGKNGRVRGDVLVLASGPANLRLGITANVVGAAGEISSDGKDFIADDKANQRYMIGPAKPCNIAKLTQVPLPSTELVPMLWGMRPKIEGPIACDGISWSDEGYFRVMLREQGKPMAHELHLAPTPEDWGKPWAQQRVRLLGVIGWGANDAMVYRVTMGDHTPTRTSEPLIDADGIDPKVSPSGPDVVVDVPRKLHVEVPGKGADVVFKYEDATVNPPLIPSAFRLNMRPGVPVDYADCED